MKRFLFISAVFAIMLTFVNCDKYDYGRPDRGIRKNFNTMFPDARDAEWDREGGYWVVSFETGPRWNDTDHEAWYNDAGEWVQTKTDMYLNSVPREIRDFLTSDSTFGNAAFEDDDVEYIQKPSGNFYRFDMRLDGREVNVDVTEDGEVKAAKYGF